MAAIYMPVLKASRLEISIQRLNMPTPLYRGHPQGSREGILIGDQFQA